MAESNGQEKTEQPTGKRRREAREKGNVFQSKDICTVVMLYGTFFMIGKMLPTIYQTIRQYMQWVLDGIGGDMTQFLSYQVFTVTIISFVKCALPLLLTAMLLGILSQGVQTRFNVSFQSIKPNFGKLNPITGIKNLFSLKKVIELLKNLLKIIILIALLYNVLKDQISVIARMFQMAPMNSIAVVLQVISDMITKVCIGFAVVAFFDYLYQRWEYEKNLKMTKQEVKEEYKQTEGNPEIKGRIRKNQRQMATSRMMQKVPEADVIIRNPTHFAVALRYRPGEDRAPIVLAKGQDELAFRIIRVGEEHDVSIIENRPLARALYASCELDREIPAEFYGAVAEILVYIYKAKNREDMFQ